MVVTTANDELLDRAIRHAGFLDRLASGESSRILRFLRDDMLPDIESQLTRRLARITERGFDLGPATTQKLRDTYAAVDTIVRKSMATAAGSNRDSLFDIAASESRFQAGVISKALPPAVAIETVLPATGLLRSAVVSRPFRGSVSRSWI